MPQRKTSQRISRKTTANEGINGDYSISAIDTVATDLTPPQLPRFNRVRIALLHGWRYAFEGQARLAQDVGVSRSTISRLINNQTTPSQTLQEKIVRALSSDIGIPLRVRDVFSPDGTYPVRSGCRTFGCEGCFPEEAYDRHGNLLPHFEEQQPGDWTLAPAEPKPVVAKPIEH